MKLTAEDGYSISVQHDGGKNRENHDLRYRKTIEAEMKNKRQKGQTEHVDLNGELEGSFFKVLTDPEGNRLGLSEDEAYEFLFADAVKDYNAKQKRADRKVSVEKYHQQVKNSKRSGAKHPQNSAYSIVMQVGNVEIQPERDLQQKILEDSAKDIQKRFPHLFFYNVVEHGDEYRIEKNEKKLNTIHVHMNYIPWSDDYKKGLQKQNGLNKALMADGLKPVKGKTLEMQLQEEIRSIVAKNMGKYHVKVLEQKPDREGLSDRHMSEEQFKTAKRIEEQEKEIHKNDEIINRQMKKIEEALAVKTDADNMRSRRAGELEARKQIDAVTNQNFERLELNLERYPTRMEKTEKMPDSVEKDRAVYNHEKKMECTVIPTAILNQLMNYARERKKSEEQVTADVEAINKAMDEEYGKTSSAQRLWNKAREKSRKELKKKDETIKQLKETNKEVYQLRIDKNNAEQKREYMEQNRNFWMEQFDELKKEFDQFENFAVSLVKSRLGVDLNEEMEKAQKARTEAQRAPEEQTETKTEQTDRNPGRRASRGNRRRGQR